MFRLQVANPSVFAGRPRRLAEPSALHTAREYLLVARFSPSEPNHPGLERLIIQPQPNGLALLLDDKVALLIVGNLLHWPSVITSKPATHDHFKTGQRTEP